MNPNLQVMFSTANIGNDIYVDAVYCKDLFADEIAKESDGRSDSNFYTKTYADHARFSWICPNVTEFTVASDELKNIQAHVYQCAQVHKLSFLYGVSSYSPLGEACDSWDNT